MSLRDAARTWLAEGTPDARAGLVTALERAGLGWSTLHPLPGSVSHGYDQAEQHPEGGVAVVTWCKRSQRVHDEGYARTTSPAVAPPTCKKCLRTRRAREIQAKAGDLPPDPGNEPCSCAAALLDIPAAAGVRRFMPRETVACSDGRPRCARCKGVVASRATSP